LNAAGGKCVPSNNFIALDIILHFAGMVLIMVSFSNIATIAYLYSRRRLKMVFFHKTRLPMYPLLIALGGTGFLYLTLSFAYTSVSGIAGTIENTRYIATGVTLSGSLLAFYGMYKIYWMAQGKMKTPVKSAER